MLRRSEFLYTVSWGDLGLNIRAVLMFLVVQPVEKMQCNKKQHNKLPRTHLKYSFLRQLEKKYSLQ